MNKPTHISVCVCTYKRPEFLKRLLDGLRDQETDGLFTCSIVVVDNDHLQSAKTVVSNFADVSPVPIRYFVEPQQSICLARNRAIANAEGDFVALIDDDEFPTKRWLVTLFRCWDEFKVDGVLGPVKPHFEGNPPAWIIKGGFCERPVYPTGTVVDPNDGRTGNVLLTKRLFGDGEQPFRTQFHSGGEDTDFFIRMTERGHSFIWSEDAVVYEVVPPARWKRRFMLRKALLRGAISLKYSTFGVTEIAKSIIAVPLYSVALPGAFLFGQHRFMSLAVRLCDHFGRLLALMRIKPVSNPHGAI
jgi:glycosyltransferase involved in cell wall biosynthesis